MHMALAHEHVFHPEIYPIRWLVRGVSSSIGCCHPPHGMFKCLIDHVAVHDGQCSNLRASCCRAWNLP